MEDKRPNYVTKFENRPWLIGRLIALPLRGGCDRWQRRDWILAAALQPAPRENAALKTRCSENLRLCRRHLSAHGCMTTGRPIAFFLLLLLLLFFPFGLQEQLLVEFPSSHSFFCLSLFLSVPVCYWPGCRDSPWTAAACSPTSRSPRSRKAALRAWACVRRTCAARSSTWRPAAHAATRWGIETPGPLEEWCSRTSCLETKAEREKTTTVNVDVSGWFVQLQRSRLLYSSYF